MLLTRGQIVWFIVFLRLTYIYIYDIYVRLGNFIEISYIFYILKAKKSSVIKNKVFLY